MWTMPFGSLPVIRLARKATIGTGTPAATACGSRRDRQSSAIPARSASGPGRRPSSAPRPASIARSSWARGPLRAAGPELISVSDAMPSAPGSPSAASPSTPSRAISPP
jgi:hypothetical protein